MARRAGRKIDFKSWLGLPSISLSIASAATTLGGALSFTGPGTILRCRGEMLITLDGVTAGEDTIVTVALGIVSTDAFNAGGGSVPDPGGDADYPWLYWKSTPLTLEHIDTGSTQFSELSASVRFEVDTKAMRKFKPNETLCWVVQTNDNIDLDVDIGITRVLIGV